MAWRHVVGNLLYHSVYANPDGDYPLRCSQCSVAISIVIRGLCCLTRVPLPFTHGRDVAEWSLYPCGMASMKNSLIICDNHVTFITDPHIELVAHDRNSCPVGAALVAHSFAAFATVVLSDPDRFLVHHCFDVPKERTGTPLARVAFSPLRSFYPLGCHVPENKRGILASRDESLSWTMIT